MGNGLQYGNSKKNQQMTIDLKSNKQKIKMTILFIKFDIEFVNEITGQVVTLTTTCGSHKELGKYLTEMEKRQWRMLKVVRKEN